MPKARAAALQSLKLDDSLAEAHTAYALIVQNYDYDWQTSDKEFRRAIELNPNYATAHHWYAEHLSWMGRFDEALAESHRALQLDPFSLIIACDNGAILYNARQYDRAIEQFRAVRELDPNFARTSLIVHSYEEKGMFAEALADLEGHLLRGAARRTVPRNWLTSMGVPGSKRRRGSGSRNWGRWPPTAFGSCGVRSSEHRHGQQGTSSCLAGKGLRAACQFHDVA